MRDSLNQWSRFSNDPVLKEKYRGELKRPSAPSDARSTGAVTALTSEAPETEMKYRSGQKAPALPKGAGAT